MTPTRADAIALLEAEVARLEASAKQYSQSGSQVVVVMAMQEAKEAVVLRRVIDRLKARKD